MGRLIEGLWDCPYCGTQGIGGSKQSCTNCGRARTKDTTFYMPGQKRYVPEEKARKANRNPDWVCEYCDNLNSDNVSSCTACGAVRGAENLNYFQNKAKESRSKNLRKKVQKLGGLQNLNMRMFGIENHIRKFANKLNKILGSINRKEKLAA